MMNLTEEQALHLLCINQWTSILPFDQWIDVTLNKGSKMKYGWVGFTKNQGMRYIHAKTISKIKSTRQALKAAANIKEKDCSHSEDFPANSRLAVKHVQDLSCYIYEWNCDLFDEQHKDFKLLESRLLESPSLVEDFSVAYKQVQSFLKEIIFSRQRSISNRKKKNDRCHFITQGKRKILPLPPK